MSDDDTAASAMHDAALRQKRLIAVIDYQCDIAARTTQRIPRELQIFVSTAVAAHFDTEPPFGISPVVVGG